MIKKFLKKIIAQNQEDLRVISALCSEAKILQSEIKFLKDNKIFLISLENFSPSWFITKALKVSDMINFNSILR